MQSVAVQGGAVGDSVRRSGGRSGPAGLSGAAGRGGASSPICELQRARLVMAAVSVIEEQGFTATTIAQITARARVSRRTFYELFANREECLAAALVDVAGQVESELTDAGLEGLSWCERIRTGVWTILCFFDREPALARVCVVEALRADQTLLRFREELLARLAAVVDEGRREGSRGGAHCSPLTAEGLVGAAFAIVHARLLHPDDGRLSDLAGELVGLLVLPYRGPAAARREQGRRPPTSVPVSASVAGGTPATLRGARDPFVGLPLRFTYRTAKVLDAVALLSSDGGHPSNRQIAERAGIHDAGQISKLLHRLQRVGLLANSGGGHPRGEPNAWALTPAGERLTQSIRVYTAGKELAA